MAITFDDLPDSKKSVALTFDDVPDTLKPEPDLNNVPWFMRAAVDLADKGVLGIAKDAGATAATGAGNVVSDIGQSAVQRTGEAAQSERDYQAGKISLPVALFQQIGKVAGGMSGDVIGSVIKNSTPDMAMQGLQGGAQQLANKIDSAAPSVGDAAMQGAKAVDKFAENNPQTWKTLEAGGDLLNIPPALAAARTLKPAVGAVGEALSDVGQGISAASDAKSITRQITPQMMNDAKNAKYKAMKGVVINPDGLKLVTQSITDELAKTGTLSPSRHSQTYSVINDINEASQKGPLTLEQIDNFRQDLGDVIKDNTKSKIDGGGLNSDGMRAAAAKRGLDNAVNQLQNEHLLNGSPDAIKALNEGRALYSAKAKVERINRIIEDASLTRNPDTAIKTGMANLYKSIRNNSQGWTPEEIAAIKHGADTGLIGGIAKLAGSRIISGIGGAVAGGIGGGIPGAVAGTAAMEALTFPARKLSNAIQAGRANKAAELVMNRPIVKSAAKAAVESGELSPKFTALRALGVTIDKAGQMMKGGKPFTMKEAVLLPPSQAKIAMDAIAAVNGAKQKP